MYLLSQGKIVIDDAKVLAPRIGVCSNNIDIINSTLSSNGRGCTAEKGLGAGKSPLHCAGAGGAHAGNGGYGGSESSAVMDKSKCRRNYPTKYTFGREARLEGSGGGNGEQRNAQKDTGGPGGGIIWITTPGTLHITNGTMIESNGAMGQYLNYEQAGAGGGAGGSVQITTLNLMGTAYISARGGAGSQGGGGGGGGGRLIINYLKNYLEGT